jgi:hypothetical protein
VLIVPSICAAASDDSEPGFVPLFDGRSLQHWIQVHQTGPGYLAKDGKIVCPACPVGCNLFSDKEYSNFVFRFEFRMMGRGANGIAVRSEIEGNPAYEAGMEIAILDDPHPVYADAKPTQRHGAVYDVIPARPGFLNKTREWNEEEITANGRRITVRLNKTVILDAELDSVKDPAVLKRHPGLARRKGRIGLVGHKEWVEFRNLRIRELP